MLRDQNIDFALLAIYELKLFMKIRLRRYKKDYKHSYAFGVFPTLELVTNKPEKTVKVLIHPKGVNNQGILKIKEICQNRDIATEVQDQTIERLGAWENDYALGIFQKSNPQLNQLTNHVVLVNPSSMGNLGTIMRTMVGFGVHDLAVIKPAADHFDPKVIRASMGAIFSLRIAAFQDFMAYQSQFQREYYPMMTDGKEAINKTTFTSPISLIFGNESSGLGNEYFALGTSLRIPQDNAVDSFNLAISVGICLYQISLTQDRSSEYK